jgi:hypothetical protein
MRTLTATLLAAQKAETRKPYIKVEARNDPLGVVNLVWERLYTGTETDGPHGATITADGSLVRIRVSSAAQSKRVYWQRVTNPGPLSDYTAWTYLNIYNVANAAACSLGATVSLFWVKTDGTTYHMVSTDNGATWGTPEVIGYAPTGAVGGMAADYRPNGDLFLFFAGATELYLIKRLSGAWQSRVTWNLTTGTLSGAAVVYDSDWKLLVSGQDSSNNYRLWSLIYGDGVEVTAGTWGALLPVMTAPSDSGYEFGPVFMDKPDVLRFFCNEKYTGDEAYNRPLRANAIPSTVYLANLWAEPKPFNYLNINGLALTHSATYAWLCCPSGIWRAPLAAVTLDLSNDLLGLKYSTAVESGQALVELQNSAGQYAAPGAGALATLYNGCRLDISLGYRTSSNEISAGPSFNLQGYEYKSAAGKASVLLYASDGWEDLSGWKARYPLRWNVSSDELSVKGILSFVLARAGLKLTVVSESTLISTFFPDFTIQAGDSGAAVVGKLLSFVADKLFIEGGLAYLVNPLAADASVYSYGSTHPILEGNYRQDSAGVNRVQASGWDPVNLVTITTDSFTWTDIETGPERLQSLEDINLETDALAHGRGETLLRKAVMAATSGGIRAATNCGLQLLDIIAITDSRAGLAAVKKRVIGFTTSYLPEKGAYTQNIQLGAP